ncbi:Pr6Pr family membrane protein [Microbacterium sp.]|uniref:Pr6Pr family membrane protein n=1 Tax=Microbacterium sp. TaxID=51671 RepID=UPI003C783BA3
MALASRVVALGYRVLASLVIFIGIARVSGLFTGSPIWTAFLYFTVLSNVLCLVWMVWSAIATIRDARMAGWQGTSTPSARGAAAVMMAITVTMLIYLVVLVPSSFQQPGAYEPFTLTDNLVHIITPLLVIADWVLFVPKGRLDRFDPLRWTLIPYSYLVLAYGYSGLGGRFAAGTRYPYPFMDVDVHGVGGVAMWIVVLTVALVGVGYGYYALDRRLGGRVRAGVGADAAADGG